MARTTFRWFWSAVCRYTARPRNPRRAGARTWPRLPLSLERLEDLTLPSAALFTDRPDYAPGQTALITGTGFQPGETVRLDLGITAPAPGQTFDPWFVTDGGAGDRDGVADGTVQTSWQVSDQARGATLLLTATGQASGLTAQATFTDSPLTAGAFNPPAGPGSAAVSTFVGGGLFGPVGPAFDAAGNLYVPDYNNNTVSKITPAGAVSTFASGGGLNGPNDVTFDAAGNLYVANFFGNTVSKITPAGAVSTFASGFSEPSGLRFDAAGNLYVTNYAANTISKVTPAGAASTFVSGLNGPEGLAFDVAGNLYVANRGGGTVSKVTPAGTASTFAGGFNGPSMLAVDAAGNLYVGNWDGNTLSKVTPAGAVSAYVSGGLSHPEGLAFDAAGNLFVVNYGSSTINKVVAPPPVEGVPFANVPVFHFTDANPAAAASDYTAVATLGDGNTVTLTGTPGPNGQVVASGTGFDVQLSHTYADELSNKPFGVVVTAAAGGSTGASTNTFGVADFTPVVAAGTPTTLSLTPTYAGTGSFTDPSADTWTATVNYGDGSGTSPLALNQGKTFNLSHTYAADGTYTVTVRVTDDEGTVGTGTFAVNVAAFTVTTTADGGAGSLRQAILNADANPDANTIKFNLPGTGVRTIGPGSALPAITAPVTIDGYSQPGASANTLAVGNNAVLLVELSGAAAGAGAAGLTITGGGSTVQGLVIDRFGGDGIDLTTAGGNTIAGNFIGTAGANGGSGISVTSAGNLVGGAAAAARNVISGNAGSGVLLTGSGATGNAVAGNYIGTNAAGTAALANGQVGIQIVGGAAGNTVGGLTATPGVAPGNVVSGNTQWGIFVVGSNNNQITGNIIGLNAAGTAAVRNQYEGVAITASAGTTVGGVGAGARNVISGNGGGYGQVELSAGTTTTTVQGNYIGTDITGTQGGLDTTYGNGITVVGAGNNLIGGTAAGAGNVISGNATGILIVNASNFYGYTGPAAGNVVQGNYIGTDKTGTAQLGNLQYGVSVSADSNTIGGAAGGAGNVISGNGQGGVLVSAVGLVGDLFGGTGTLSATGNVVQGNFIGTTAAGTAALGNRGAGVLIGGGASGNTVGGPTAAARNVISGNTSHGIDITGGGTTGNTVLGNYIGTDSTGTAGLGNGSDGVKIENGASGNTVGGTTGAAAAAPVSANLALWLNADQGVTADGSGQVTAWADQSGHGFNGTAQGGGVTLQSAALKGHNLIHFTGGGDLALTGQVLTSQQYTILAVATDQRTDASFREVFSNWSGSNSVSSVFLGTTGNNPDRARFTDYMGGATDPNGHGQAGVGTITNPTQAFILTGVSTSADAFIYQNQTLIAQSGSPIPTRNLTTQYFVGTQGTINGEFWRGDIAEILVYNGALSAADLQQDWAYLQAKYLSQPANVISGNAGNGVEVSASGNTVAGNLVGTNAAGTALLGNAGSGVALTGANNTVGGSAAGAGNVIAGQTGAAGISISGPAATGNVVAGNFVGLNAAGTAKLGAFGDDVNINSGATGNLVGTDRDGVNDANERNVLAGASFMGVAIYNDNTNNNTVAGNYIGTDATGTVALGNQSAGVAFGFNTAAGAGGNKIVGNVISGNPTGITIDALTHDTTVAGNFIGTAAGGTAALGNGTGVFIAGHGNTVGGTTAAAGNVIAGNTGNGVQISGAAATGNVIAANYIGTNPSGTAGLGNAGRGISISGSPANTVLNNTVSGNTGDGINVTGNGAVVGGTAALPGTVGWFRGDGTPTDATGANNGTFQGTAGYAPGLSGQAFQLDGTNYVQAGIAGLPTGSADRTMEAWVKYSALPNHAQVIAAYGLSTSNIGDAFGLALSADGHFAFFYGGFLAWYFDPNNAAYNVPVLNQWNHLALSMSGGVTSLYLNGSFIGTFTEAMTFTSGSLTIGRRPTTAAVTGTYTGLVDDVAVYNRALSGAEVQTVYQLDGASKGGTVIQGNVVGLNPATGAAQPNLGNGVTLSGSAGNLLGGTTAAARNVISGNNQVNNFGQAGVLVSGAASVGNVLQGNYVGLNQAGNAPVPNRGLAGVSISGAVNTVVGGAAPGAGNVISGNSTIGVIMSGGANGTVMQGNYVGTDATGATNVSPTNVTLSNGSDGIRLTGGAHDNTIGGAAAGTGNVIDGNGFGIQLGLAGGAPNNTIQGNLIGLDATGLTPLGVGTDGVSINAGSNNTKVLGNVIAATGQRGPNAFGQSGVHVYANGGATPTGTVIQNNRIGTNVNGGGGATFGSKLDGIRVEGGGSETIAGNVVANSTGVGVNLLNGSSTNTIGGPAAADRNVITANAGGGISVAGGSNNVISGNNVGVAGDGTTVVPNGAAPDVFVDAGSGKITLASGLTAGPGGVSVTATDIRLNGGVGTASGPVSLTGPVTLGADVALATAGGAVTFGGTVDGGFNLTLTAGTGAVTFAGAVGGAAGGRLGAVTVNSAGDVTVAAGLKAASLTQAAGTGTTTLGGAVDLSGAAGASVTTTAVAVTGSLTAIAGGVALTAAGGVTQAAGSSITTVGTATVAVTATAGSITMAPDAVTVGGSGAIAYQAGGGVAVGALTTGGTVGLTAGGAITDANGAGVNVTAAGLTAAAGAGIDLDTAVAAATAAGGAGGVGLRNAGGLTVGGVTAGGAVAVSTTGPLTLAGAVTGTGGGVTLVAGNGGPLTANAAITAGAGGVALTAGAMTLTQPVTASAAVTLTNAGTLTITATAPVSAGGAVTQSGGPVVTAGNVTAANAPVSFASPVTLAGPVTVGAGTGDVTFADTVTGPFALTVNGGGATTFAGAVSLASLDTDAGGTTAVSGGSVTTTGPQTYRDAVTLGADTTLAAATVTTLGTVTGNGHGLTVIGSAVFGDEPADVVTGLSALSVGGPTALAGGSVTSTGPQTFTGVVTVSAGPHSFTSTGTGAAGAITFTAALTGNGSVTVNTAGTTTLGGSSTLAALTTDAAGGTTVAGGAVTTTAAQSYGDPVTLAADTTFAGGTASFGQTVGGPYNLTLAVGGPTTFAGAVTVGSGTGAAVTINSAGPTEFRDAVTVASGVVQADAAGVVTFRKNVTEAGGDTDTAFNANVVLDGLTAFTSQRAVAFGNAGTDGLTVSTSAVALTTTAGGVTIRAATTLAAGLAVAAGANDINLFGTVDGNAALSLAAGGTTTIGQAVGGVVRLSSITTGSAGTTRVGADVSAQGNSTTFNNPVVLDADVQIIDSGNVTFNSTVTTAAGKGLAVTSGGDVTFAQAVAVQFLTVADAANVAVIGPVATAGPVAVTARNAVTVGAIGTGSGGQVTITAGGKIIDGNGAADNITTNNLVLTAGGDIGTAADPLETVTLVTPTTPDATLNLTAHSDAGGIVISNTGSLTVLAATAAGTVSLEAHSPLTVKGPVTSAAGSVQLAADNGTLTVAPNTPVTAQTDVNFSAGTLTIDKTAQIQATTGSVGLDADSATLKDINLGTSSLSFTKANATIDLSGADFGSLTNQGAAAVISLSGADFKSLTNAAQAATIALDGANFESLVNQGAAAQISLDGADFKSLTNAGANTAIISLDGANFDSLVNSGASVHISLDGADFKSLVNSGLTAQISLDGANFDSLVNADPVQVAQILASGADFSSLTDVGTGAKISLDGADFKTLINAGSAATISLDGANFDSLVNAGTTAQISLDGADFKTLVNTGASTAIISLDGANFDSLVNAGANAVISLDGAVFVDPVTKQVTFTNADFKSLVNTGAGTVISIDGAKFTDPATGQVTPSFANFESLVNSGANVQISLDGASFDSLTNSGAGAQLDLSGADFASLVNTAVNTVISIDGADFGSLINADPNQVAQIAANGADFSTLTDVGTGAKISLDGADFQTLVNAGSHAQIALDGADFQTLINSGTGAVVAITLDGANFDSLYNFAAGAAIDVTGADLSSLTNNGVVTVNLSGADFQTLVNTAVGATIAIDGADFNSLVNTGATAAISLDGADFGSLVNSAAAVQITIVGADFNSLQNDGANAVINISGVDFASLVNTGSGATVNTAAALKVNGFTFQGASFQFFENDADNTGLTVGSGGGSSTVVNNGNNVTVTYTGGPGDDVFVNDGRGDTAHGNNVTLAVDLGAGNDRFVIGGTNVKGTVTGGSGDDTYTFAGGLAGDLTVKEADNADTDALDFSNLTTGAVTIDLAATAKQAVAPGLSLTLSSGTGIENVVGTQFADTIRGNSRDNTLSGADLADDRVGTGPGWNKRTQTVYLDFDSQTDPGEHVYTPAERNAIQARLEADYHGPTATSDPGTWWFHVAFTQTRPAGVQNVDYVTVYFNQPRQGGAEGSPGLGGDSSEIDFGNRSYGGWASVAVQMVDPVTHAVTALIGGAGQPPEYNSANTADQSWANDNWVRASAWIAAHEVGHLMGLRHADSFGPVGYGIHNPPGIAGFFISPTYNGPSAAFETDFHLIAAPQLTGFTLNDLVGDTYFGEREAVKLAYDTEAPVAPGPDGSLLVAEQAAAVNGSRTVAGSQNLTLASLDVPDTLTRGLNSIKQFLVGAVDVLGSISSAAEKDLYHFAGRKGDLLNLQVMSEALNRDAGQAIDAYLTVYDSAGNVVATSDDESETHDPSVIDLRLTKDDTYYVEVRNSLPTPHDGLGVTGKYELFVYRFDTANPADGGDTIEGRGGNDTLAGGMGNDAYVFGGTNLGTDTVLEDVRYEAQNGTVGGRDTRDKLDFSAFGGTVALDLAKNTAQVVNAPNLTLQLSSGLGIEDVVVPQSYNATVAGNARDNTFTWTNRPAGAAVTDTITGRDGRDGLDFGALTAGVTVDLSSRGTQAVGGGYNLVLTAEDVENLAGSATAADTLTGNTLNNILVGGAGNDQLDGGSGNDILVGNAGDDMLVGGAGDDLLIGGTGADRLVASSGSDILIAGSTAYDFTGFDPAKGYDPNKAAALLAILAEWTNAGESYATRNLAIAGKAGIGHLNGGYFLNAATVSSDTSVDKLTGSSGVDWYFVDNTADIDPIDTVTGNTSGDYWTFIN